LTFLLIKENMAKEYFPEMLSNLTFFQLPQLTTCVRSVFIKFAYKMGSSSATLLINLINN